MRAQRGAAADEARRRAMAVLARAEPAALKRLWTGFGEAPEATPLRGPETGLVTVQGRIGGGGAPFNLGEATVTRATVRLASGEIGHAYALGRDGEKALISATLDALWQDPQRREEVEKRILEPLRAAEAESENRLREEAAATKVDFFTMVRGED